jgi:alginate O-acetyltransferase complex protein AlgI
MTLLQILILACLSLTISIFPKARRWLLVLLSGLAIYMLQPALPIRGLDYWLPTFTLFFCVLVWTATQPSQKKLQKEDWFTLIILAGLMLGVGSNRYLAPLCCLTPTIPPPLAQIGIGLFGFGLILITARFMQSKPHFALGSLLVVLIAILIGIKSPGLNLHISSSLRAAVGQRPDLATPVDIQWLGFSYFAFRAIHILRDRLSRRLPEVSLREMITFLIFVPAFPSGPIDRIQRFSQDEQKTSRLDLTAFWQASQRIVRGIVKKFIFADSLALIALTEQTAPQIHSQFWSWIILYGYAFRIYWDFSGYTDIALGIGQYLGFQLPENFNKPYRATDLTQFWNSWHITLAQWFRAYFFNPLTRWMRTHFVHAPIWLMMLLAQTSTMLLIGLWHGLTWNFAIWGLWHGLGLFIHNRWNAWTQQRFANIEANPWLSRMRKLGGVLITFHFVAVSWVWFSLPNLDTSLRMFATLLGFSTAK